MKKIAKLLTIITMFILGMCKVYALDISINEIKIFDKSDSITVNNVSSNNLTITPDIKFNNVGDYVTFKVEFKGTDIKKNKILSVTDNNHSEYIKINYKHDETLSYPLYIVLSYDNGSINNVSLDDIYITINLEDGSDVVLPISNPQTGLFSHIMVPLVLIVISFFLIKHYTKYQSDTTMMILLLSLLMIPLTVIANVNQKLSLVLDTSNIVIKNVEAIPDSKPSTPQTTEPSTPQTTEPSNDQPSVPADTKPKATAGQGLWVAHQKNDADRVQKAISAGFWGIEVDVNQSGNVFQLKHDTYHGYNLDAFLDTCKKNNIIAVLDIKSVSNYSSFVGLVKDKGMLNYTIFQTGNVSVVKSLYAVDNNVRIWFLNSASTAALRTSDINSVKDKLEGVNMLALSVDSNVIKQVHNMGLTICAFSYNDTMYDSQGKSAKNLKSWGVDYLMANAITKTNEIGEGSGGAGDCKGSYTGQKYSLTDAQKKKIAGMVLGEYGSDLNGMKAVASQMANLYEINSYYNSNCTKNRTFYEYITLPVGSCGWYATYDASPTTNANALKAVEDVIVNGNRTLPLYIDEFDWYPNDIIGATSVNDSQSYKVGVTKLRNKYDSEGTYYCITKGNNDANVFFFTKTAENYRVAKGYSKGY